MLEYFKFLKEQGFLTGVFIIGAFAVMLAVIGKVMDWIDIPKPRAILLGVFGLALWTATNVLLLIVIISIMLWLIRGKRRKSHL